MTTREHVINQVHMLPEQLLENVKDFISSLTPACPQKAERVSAFASLPETDDSDDLAAWDAAVAAEDEDDDYCITHEKLVAKYGL